MKHIGIYAGLGAALIGSVAMIGCDEASKATGGLCCEDFEVGADMSGASFGLEGQMQARFRAFAQAMGDLSAVGAATLGDVEVSCMNLAKDMGATDADIKAELDKSGSAKVTGLCTLAAAQIEGMFGTSGEFSAQGSLDIQFTPPVCSASVSAQADCQGGCSASAECDVQANPPTCEGGKMEVSCSGSCTAEAGASVQCEGGCTGTCSGSCTADVGATVDCQGKCDGTCTAGGSANGSGIQADGSCDGQCDGTCEMSADAQVQCSGTCKGECSASCEAEAGASVKCDGECSGSVEPLKCEGGELKGGCDVDADCEANCSASASAKAECHPPAVNVVFQASAGASLEADAQMRLNAAIGSIKANLPNLLVAVQARGQAFVTALGATVNSGGSFFANADPGDLSVQAVACIPGILAAGGTAVDNMQASVDASVSVLGALNINN